MNTPLTIEPVCCPLCGECKNTLVLAGPDRVHHVPGIFTLCRCQGCGLIYQNPRPAPNSFAAIYPAEYGPYQPLPANRKALHPDLTRAVRLVDRHQPGGGKLLDIGCGPGSFLQAIRLLHPAWELAGIEPDPQAAAQARQAGLAIQNSTIEAASLMPNDWDAITLWNVIEHVPDPLRTLRHCRQLLRQDGLLYMAVPLCDSWEAQIYRRYWIGWELPRHFFAFDRHSLQRLLELAGFQSVAEQCINGRSYGFTASLRLVIQEYVHSYTLRRLGEALTYSRPLSLALLPYTLLATALRRCTVLTIAARPVAGSQK